MPDFLALLSRDGASSLFLVVLGERLGLPLPAAPLLLLAGDLATRGRLSWPALIGACVAANVLADGAWFEAGRRFGQRALHTLCRVSLSQDSCVRESADLIRQRGALALLGAKFLPGLSLVVAPMAGALGMPRLRFLLIDTLAALVWTLAYSILGALFRTPIEAALDRLDGSGPYALGLLALLLLAFIVRRALARRRATRTAAEALITVEAAASLAAAQPPALFLDVRSASMRAVDPRAIPGGTPVPLAALAERAGTLSPGRVLIAYCSCPNDLSARQAVQTLIRLGHTEARVLAGGLEAWVDHGLPTVEADHPEPASATVATPTAHGEAL